MRKCWVGAESTLKDPDRQLNLIDSSFEINLENIIDKVCEIIDNYMMRKLILMIS
jgi:hypothetical protein